MSVRLKFIATVAAMVVCAGAASAGSIPYPNPGTPNPVIYTFTAATTGDITAYFAGSGASFDEEVGLLVNGVQQGPVGLDDHTSYIGEALDFGTVAAGSTLVFFDEVFTTGNTWYSDPSLNTDGGNHVYSTSATAGQVYAGSPAGTYVGFEDQEFPNSDYNYYDDTFVFTNTSTVVPEPATWAMMLAGFFGLGAVLRDARRKPSGDVKTA
jgi:hypothetical protein